MCMVGVVSVVVVAVGVVYGLVAIYHRPHIYHASIKTGKTKIILMRKMIAEIPGNVNNSHIRRPSESCKRPSKTSNQ